MGERAVIYTRQSTDAAGTGLAVARQQGECEKLARARGWRVVARLSDNDTSASNGKPRPAFAEAMRMAEAGECGIILVWAVDRLVRKLADLEAVIDVCERAGVKLATVSGDLDLSTDQGRLVGRILASVARGEMERKSARQKLAAVQRSEQGGVPLGGRLTGYTTKGTVIPAEAALVRELFSRFAAGASLHELAVWLQDEGVPTRFGGQWRYTTVRRILTNPRYAGRAVYHGQANGHRGTWEPIVDEALFDTVNARLADPRRRKAFGTERKHLGSSLYRCGICDKPMRAARRKGQTTYTCNTPGHMTRTAAPIDSLVTDVIRARLARPDLADLLARPDSAESRALAAEIRKLRGRLVQTEADYDADLIDARRYRVKTDKLNAELSTALARQARLSAGSGVARTLAAKDPVAAYDAAPLGVKRAVLAFLMTVRLNHAPRGVHFNPESVQISWNSAR